MVSGLALGPGLEAPLLSPAAPGGGGEPGARLAFGELLAMLLPGALQAGGAPGGGDEGAGDPGGRGDFQLPAAGTGGSHPRLPGGAGAERLAGFGPAVAGASEARPPLGAQGEVSTPSLGLDPRAGAEAIPGDQRPADTPASRPPEVSDPAPAEARPLDGREPRLFRPLGAEAQVLGGREGFPAAASAPGPGEGRGGTQVRWPGWDGARDAGSGVRWPGWDGARSGREAAGQPGWNEARAGERPAGSREWSAFSRAGDDALAALFRDSGLQSAVPGEMIPGNPAPLGPSAPAILERVYLAVVREVEVLPGREETALELGLEPPHLGPLGVRLLWTRGRVELGIEARNPAVLEILTSHLPLLQDLLLRAGVPLGEVRVSLGRQEGLREKTGERRGDRVGGSDFRDGIRG